MDLLLDFFFWTGAAPAGVGCPGSVMVCVEVLSALVVPLLSVPVCALRVPEAKSRATGPIQDTTWHLLVREVAAVQFRGGCSPPGVMDVGLLKG